MSSHFPGGPGASDGKDIVSGGPSTSSGERNSAGDTDFTYTMEHLATFTVTEDTGIIYPIDGMRRLLQLEKTNGIWSQKMQLCLERDWVLILDSETRATMERFPIALVQEPTSFTSDNPMEMYNNILVFTVADDANSGQAAEMHIFQCQSASAQDLVEDLKMLQSGKLVPGVSPRGPRRRIPPPPTLPPPEPPFNGHRNRGHIAVLNAEGPSDASRDDNNDEASSTSSERYERDVTVLNRCFDDIEKFIARLQHAAAATKELERRRRNSKSKKRNLGDGMLTMRTKPPLEMEFVDIFQKFKLSFNLLAKLKAHIHDPNAPELVHFLFTPLALIVDASHDTNNDTNLPSKIVSPLLTREAINLLIHCVTSKETELWHSLGDAWLVPRDQWKSHVAPYYPVFTDGWSPDYPLPEEQQQQHQQQQQQQQQQHHHHHHHHRTNHHDHHLASLLNADKQQKRDEITDQSNDPYYGHHHHHHHHHHNRNRDTEESHYSSDYLDYETRDEPRASTSGGGVGVGVGVGAGAGAGGGGGGHNDYYERDYGTGTGVDIYSREDRDRAEQSRAHSDISLDSIERTGAPSRGNAGTTDRAQDAWLDDLLNRNAKIVQVTYPRTANNDKELTVVRGEFLEIIDDSRKWWKAKNSKGQIAHVPHTIVTQHNANTHPGDNDAFNNPMYANRYNRLGHGYNYEDVEIEMTSTSPGPEPTHRPLAPAPAEWVRRERLGKKGEFRYF